MTNDDYGDYIDKYSRKQAIESGTLIDVTPFLPEFELRFSKTIKCPTAITDTVFAVAGELKANIYAILLAFSKEALRDLDVTDVHFEALDRKMWARIGPGDTADPVLTIMLEGED